MNRSCRGFGILLALLCGWCGARPAWADGLIIIHDPPIAAPGHFAFAPLQVSYHHVTVEINDLIAVTKVDQEFYNPNSQRLEGTYLFPLPAGAHIDHFAMDIGGKMMEAELLPADKARSFYEEVVRKYKDPALLEYMGRDAIKVRIFPIEPNSRKQIKLQYTQLLKSDSGLVEYAYPLSTEKFSSAPLNDVSVKVTLTCKDALKSVYSPSHNVEIKRDGETRAIIGYEEKNVRPDTDFKVLFSRSRSPVGVDLLTYRAGPGDGYFMLLASPGMTAPRGEIQKKDICFVLDTSGSMAGPKIEQAKKALLFCLNNLNEGDRFQVIRFSTETEILFGELQAADKPAIEKAIAFVKDIKAIGGTAIADALQAAIASLNRPADNNAGRSGVVVFLTDGLPTVGNTNEDSIVSGALAGPAGPAAAWRKPRIFSFGIGTDVNTHLLDRLANDSKAFSTYVLPQEDIEVKVSNFYTKIKEPVLSNVSLSFGGPDIQISQLYPSSMPDLFKGEMLVAFGRYYGNGAGSAKISGTLNGEPREFAADVNFAENDAANAYIPRLWATRRVGWLLDEIRLHGESAELKDEVTRLAREHGIVTPYTAYLILEDEERRRVPLALQTLRELNADSLARTNAHDRFDQARSEAQQESRRTGAGAVAAAKDVQSLKSSENAQQGLSASTDLAKRGAGFATTQPRGYREAQNYAQQARVVNGRAFYQNGNTWTDATAQTGKSLKETKIAFNSDDYFALLQKHPNAAQWLALGNEVDVVIGDTLYMIR